MLKTNTVKILKFDETILYATHINNNNNLQVN